MVDEEIKKYLSETPKDAKVLRNINIDFLKKEVDKGPDEEIRDYFARLQDLERENPPIFPIELVNWIEGLDDRYFPRDGRKIFAKWLGNAIYHEETESGVLPSGLRNRVRGPEFGNLSVYNNDIRYIVDYLNGAENVAKEVWDLNFPQMMHAAESWHDEFKGKVSTGDYETKDTVHDFGNGFTMVKVPSEDLEAEGDKMGHCVGGYCEYVDRGSTTIFSLRDKKNEPHVTIEVQGEEQIVQIKGKGNDTPVEKYRPMIRQWIQDNFEPDAYLKSDGVEDYINLLDTGEILPLITSGNLKKAFVTRHLEKTGDERLVDYFLDLKREWGGPQTALSALMKNPRLTQSQAEKLVVLELIYGFAGSGIESLFSSSSRSYEGKKFDGEEFISRAWEFSQRYGHKKHSTWVVGYILEYTKNRELREEIMNDLFSDEAMQRIEDNAETEYDKAEETGNWEGIDASGALYRGALRNYLEKGDHDKKTIQRMYNLTRSGTELNRWAFGESTAGIDRYFAKSNALSDEIIDKLIKTKDDYGGHIERTLVENPAVPEKYKYGILQKLFNNKSDGWMNVYGSALYRSISRGWNDGNYSEKFLHWMIDAGLFNAAIEKASQERFREQNSRGPGRNTDYKEYEKMKIETLEIFRKTASMVAKKGPQTGSPPWQDTNLNEDIDVYLKKKNRPWGNIEDILEEDAEVIQGWMNEILDADDFQW